MKKSIAVLAHPLFNFTEMLTKNLPDYNIREIKYSGYGDSISSKLETLTKEENDALLKEIEQSEVLLVDPYLIIPIVNDIKKIKWVQGIWAGVDVLTPIFNKNNIPTFQYTRFGGKFGQHLSEYVIAHVVNSERKTHFLYDQQKKRIWSQSKIIISSAPYRLLSQLSVSILGAGEIGCEIAKHCKSFGMTVYGMVSKEREGKIENIDELFTSSSLPIYLQKSDYIVNVLPKTPQTTGILSNSILKNCTERQSVFINVGRGNVLTELDIIEAIEKKWISSAILDVFEKEPLPPNSKLWDISNVTITPHVAGLAMTTEVIEIFLENLKRYEEGKPLNHVVDWVRGY